MHVHASSLKLPEHSSICISSIRILYSIQIEPQFSIPALTYRAQCTFPQYFQVSLTPFGVTSSIL